MLKFTRAFGNWSPGAIWNPPKQFFTVNLANELTKLCNEEIRQNQKPLEEILESELNQVFKDHPKKGVWRKKRGGHSVTIQREISNLLYKDRSLVYKQRQCRLETRFSEPAPKLYNNLITSVYDRRPNPAAIGEAYSMLPSPQPKHIDPQILDDLLQILLSLRHSHPVSSGNVFMQVIDDMIASDYLVTSRERAFYLLFLSYCKNMDDIGEISTRRARISEKMISWHEHFTKDNDRATHEILLQVGLRLDMSMLEDFVQQEMSRYSPEMYRQLLKAKKMTVQRVLQMSTLNNALVTSILDNQLRADNSQVAEDFLARVCANHKHTLLEPMGPYDHAKVQIVYPIFDFMRAEGLRVVEMPLVPSKSLFMLFLTYFTRTENFPKIQRTLVQMASHGCYPQGYAIHKILTKFAAPGNQWNVSELDTLIYYICDVSLYHEILTVPLVKQLANVYKRYDPQASRELNEFLMGLVGSKRKHVPVKRVELVSGPDSRCEGGKW